MNTRPLGDQRITEIGLGCWQIGGDQWGDVSDADALATLAAAYDSGVRFFDTADIYGLGRSESLIARFVREQKPKDLVIATKLGKWPQPGGTANLTASSLRKFTEESLRRLEVDCLDLTQFHCLPLSALDDGAVFDTLRDLVREGKICRFGASVESMVEAKACLKQDGLASLQIIFNIYRQAPIAAIFDEALAKGVAIIVRLPLASGLLGGKYTLATTFDPRDHRNYNRNGERFNVGETFASLGFENGLAVTEKLRPLVPSGMSMADMALRWCLDFPAVTTLIPGARNAEQARRNAAAASLPPLDSEFHATLKQFYHHEVVPHLRGPQ
jgi:aryl-alcohol dehydrogenase-like predicted oxidoreductase